ncbi:glucose-1-phosphate adenylyltransferase [Meiothermus granaticius]|uniref:Glucose-1-phosphate adenylyltransferase n=1 Tax=Meiothermus granaticius NBRC 107808 TaxID=1227551 RepID=A0A399FDP6_9DEIN|nr:Glucose-1-phosphate adenylyltransferase [Meiothermus granaticius NBRC 107808]GEM87839.1 glucose-1-phosphate adenylyltransferase [Meiothermus granaticius NBRC 107808]
MSLRVLGMILAGGQGSRLYPLTAKRAKPSVPFGARYRIIDFVLNNFLNSGIHSIYVLTQFKAQSLTEHVQRHWRFGGMLEDFFVLLVPAQMYRYEELGPVWYRGTADAIYQNLHLVNNHKSDVVAIFGGDHIFKMNVAHMIEYHADNRADLTIAAYPVPIEQASRFGVLQVDEGWRLVGFQEKPKEPTPIPGDPGWALVSMGNYLFRTEALVELLEHDAREQNSSHDFGKDVIPRALSEGYRIQVYDFKRNPIPGQSGPNTYWRDVGTLDAYFEASMDLIAVTPEFDLFNPEWPLRAANFNSPPAKFVHEAGSRTGQAFNSLIAGGTIISGGTVRESVIFRRSRINSYALVERSILFDGVEVGRYAKLKNVIVDKNVRIPPNTTIGYDLEADRARGFTVTSEGIVVVGKSYRF